MIKIKTWLRAPLIAVTLAFTGSMAAHAAPTDDLKRGQDALRLGNKRDAILLFKKVLRETTNNELKTEASKELGNLYFKSEIAQEREEALRIYENLADEGNAEAQLNLARRYDQGMKVERSSGQSMTYYYKAAQQVTNPAIAANAWSELGDLLLRQAFSSFQKASEKQEFISIQLRAKLILAKMYEMGTGVNPDYVKALRLYEEVARQSNVRGSAAQAQFRAAFLYENMEKDPVNAAVWYKISELGQYPPAMNAFERAFEALTPAQKQDYERRLRLCNPLNYQNC